MSSWSHAFGTSWGAAWGEVVPAPTFFEPLCASMNTGHELLAVGTGCQEMSVNSGSNYLTVAED